MSLYGAPTSSGLLSPDLASFLLRHNQPPRLPPCLPGMQVCSGQGAAVRCLGAARPGRPGLPSVPRLCKRHRRLDMQPRRRRAPGRHQRDDVAGGEPNQLALQPPGNLALARGSWGQRKTIRVFRRGACFPAQGSAPRRRRRPRTGLHSWALSWPCPVGLLPPCGRVAEQQRIPPLPCTPMLCRHFCGAGAGCCRATAAGRAAWRASTSSNGCSR